MCVCILKMIDRLEQQRMMMMMIIRSIQDDRCHHEFQYEAAAISVN